MDGSMAGIALCDETCLASAVADAVVLAAEGKPLDIYYAAEYI